MRALTSIALVALAAAAAPRTICAQSASPAVRSVAGGSAATGPIGAYDVIPELPGMGRPVDIAATAARRRALLQRIGRGAVLLPAAHERNIEQDYVQDNDFRQDNTFYYLTELETQDAWVLLSGITTVLPLDSLDTRLQRIRFGSARGGAGPVYIPLGPNTRDERRISDFAFSGADVRNLLPIVDSMRVVKDADEIARLRRAVNISVAGHIAAMRTARPGMYEYELEAALEDGFRRNGADRLGYPSIVGSGPNSTTLHYDVNRRQTRDGDLVVVDAGAEWGQYTADVTRTFPVNGKFTPRQKAIYDLVLATQQVAFDSVRPGMTMRQLDGIARRYMQQHSGTLCGQ